MRKCAVQENILHCENYISVVAIPANLKYCSNPQYPWDCVMVTKHVTCMFHFSGHVLSHSVMHCDNPPKFGHVSVTCWVSELYHVGSLSSHRFLQPNWRLGLDLDNQNKPIGDIFKDQAWCLILGQFFESENLQKCFFGLFS